MPSLTLLVTSSGWLKAIPQPSLGLAFPGPEFVVGLHLWLGFSLFPFPPLCTCLSLLVIVCCLCSVLVIVCRLCKIGEVLFTFLYSAKKEKKKISVLF